MSGGTRMPFVSTITVEISIVLDTENRVSLQIRIYLTQPT